VTTYSIQKAVEGVEKTEGQLKKEKMCELSRVHCNNIKELLKGEGYTVVVEEREGACSFIKSVNGIWVRTWNYSVVNSWDGSKRYPKGTLRFEFRMGDYGRGNARIYSLRDTASFNYSALIKVIKDTIKTKIEADAIKAKRNEKIKTVQNVITEICNDNNILREYGCPIRNSAGYTMESTDYKVTISIPQENTAKLKEFMALINNRFPELLPRP
jgi:hypothetical protein